MSTPSFDFQPDSFQSDAFFDAYVQPSNIKTFEGLAIASVKTFNGVTVSTELKTWNGLA